MATDKKVLQIGDVTSKGMKVVGIDPGTRKLLLRSGFNQVDHTGQLGKLGPFGLTPQNQAIEIAAREPIYGYTPGTLRLATMNELRMIARTLSPGERNSLRLVWSCERANVHVGYALDMRNPEDETRNPLHAERHMNVCFVQTMDV